MAAENYCIPDMGDPRGYAVTLSLNHVALDVRIVAYSEPDAEVKAHSWACSTFPALHRSQIFAVCKGPTE